MIEQTQQTTSDIPFSGYKVCTTCETPLPLSEFYDDHRSADGKYSDCKSCHIRKTVSGRRASQPTPAQQITASLDERWKAALDSIATPTCSNCESQSVKSNAASGRGYVCRCVHYKIYDDLIEAYEQSRASEGTVTEHRCPGFPGGRSYSRKNQEFVADVELALKRVCRQLDEEYADIFPYHTEVGVSVLLDGWDLRLKLRHMRLSEDWHRRAKVALNRVKVALARHAVEVQPYALFPIRKYFAENTVINTTEQHPSRRREIKTALAKDACGRSEARWGKQNG